jgi:hypothetical protein
VDQGQSALRSRRQATALAVLAIGALASLSIDPTGVMLEFPAFAFVALCAFFFLSRAGALVLAAGMAGLTVWSNYDISTSTSSTASLGFIALFFLLFVVAVVGVVLDLVIGLLWRSAHWRSPLA